MRITRKTAARSRAFALTRLLGQLLFEVEPTDPATFVSVSVFLGVVTLFSLPRAGEARDAGQSRGCAP